jgi:hypothetical protein
MKIYLWNVELIRQYVEIELLVCEKTVKHVQKMQEKNVLMIENENVEIEK